MNFDKTFYEQVLKNYYKDQTIELLSVNEKPALEEKENFCSDVFRIYLKFSRISPSADDENRRINETRSLFLKQERIGNPDFYALALSMLIFIDEHRILREIVPRIEAKLGVRLAPKLVYGKDDPPRAIIMEDLTPQRFITKNKQQGLSMAHSTMVIKNLAMFHAGSVALWEENPEALTTFKQGLFNANIHPNMYKYIANSLLRLSEEALTWSDEEIGLAAKKLRDIAPSIKNRILDVYEYDDDEFCVLNHGDTWFGNILFTEDESGKPLDQVFVDYQMSRFSSPAIDLLHFIGINPVLEVRGKGEEILLETYLETLTISMKKLRCKTQPPTMMHLKKAMYRRRAYAVVSSLFMLPQITFDKEKIEGMDELLKNGTSKANIYERPETIRMMKRMLPLMNDRGYLDP